MGFWRRSFPHFFRCWKKWGRRRHKAAFDEPPGAKVGRETSLPRQQARKNHRGGAPLTQLPVKWFGTLLKNLPMAFFWNMFAAAPFTNWVCGKLFR